MTENQRDVQTTCAREGTQSFDLRRGERPRERYGSGRTNSESRNSNVYMANVMATTEASAGRKIRRLSSRALLEVDDESEVAVTSDSRPRVIRTGHPSYGTISDVEIYCSDDEKEHGISNEVFSTSDDETIASSPALVEEIPSLETPPLVHTIYMPDTDLTVDVSCLKSVCSDSDSQQHHCCSVTVRDSPKEKAKSQYYEDKCGVSSCSRPGSSLTHGSSLGWRPVMPGYKGTDCDNRSFFFKRSMEMDTYDGSLRDAIPCMPRLIAVICLVLNILLPGIGTLLAGFSVLCCSSVRGGGGRVSVIWINSCVMLLQIITTPLFLLGWIWSILWGLSFLVFAEPYWCICDLKLCKRQDEVTESVETTGESESPGTRRQSSASSTQIRTASTPESPGNITPRSEPTRRQSLIVLQEAPMTMTSENVNFYANEREQATRNESNQNSRRHSMVYNSSSSNSRQGRINSRRHSDVQAMLLNPTALENIIARNGMIPSMFRSNNAIADAQCRSDNTPSSMKVI